MYLSIRLEKETPAAEYKEQVSPQEKERRSSIIIEIAKESEAAFKNRFLNKKVDVLFEHKMGENSNSYEGHTDNYIRVIAQSTDDIKGKIKPVKLISIKEDYLKGIVE